MVFLWPSFASARNKSIGRFDTAKWLRVLMEMIFWRLPSSMALNWYFGAKIWLLVLVPGPKVFYSDTSYFDHKHGPTVSGIKSFSLKTDFRLFSNSQDHSWDQCKSEEKIFMGERSEGAWENGLSHSIFKKCFSFQGLCPRTPIFYNISCLTQWGSGWPLQPRPLLCTCFAHTLLHAWTPTHFSVFFRNVHFDPWKNSHDPPTK